jgi:hypothetical protein
VQPGWCFHLDGTPRAFGGGGGDNTLFPAWWVILILAIASYVLMIWVRTGVSPL